MDLKNRNFKVRALGEIAIRCADIDKMTAFYRDVIGLDVLSDSRDNGIIFFKITDDFAGHTSVLALFDYQSGRADLHGVSDQPPKTGTESSLHHIALSLTFDEQDEVIKWYDSLNLNYNIQEFNWIGWRGIFTEDPEGNTVELVAYDKSMLV